MFHDLGLEETFVICMPKVEQTRISCAVLRGDSRTGATVSPSETGARFLYMFLYLYLKLLKTN